MTKKLKIAFVTNNYKPYSGGVVSSIDAFCKGLQADGHTVFIITLSFKGYHEEDPPHVIRLRCPLQFIYQQKPLSLPFDALHQVQKIINEHNIDIIHSHHPFLLGAVARKVARLQKIPIIFTHHSFYTEYVHNIPLPPQLTKPLVEKITTDYCRHVDHIIAPGKATRRYLEAHGIQTPITILPSPINDIFFATKERIFDQPYKLLSVSRFTKEKNILFLLSMVDQLPRTTFHLTLAGYGPELAFLKEEVARRALTNNVTFVIAPSKAELLQLYQISHVFIFASQTETQGIVLAEAMATGLPVIALHGPGQEDIIQHGKNGYLVHSQEEMIKQLLFLLQQPSHIQQLEQGALNSALAYKSPLLSQQLLRLYKTLVFDGGTL